MTKIITRSRRALLDFYLAFAVFTIIATGFCALWIFVFVPQPASPTNVSIAVIVCFVLWLGLTWQLRLNLAKTSPTRMLIEETKIILLKPLPKEEKKSRYAKVDKTQKFEQLEILIKDIKECKSQGGHTIIITTKKGIKFEQDYINDLPKVIEAITMLMDAD